MEGALEFVVLAAMLLLILPRMMAEPVGKETAAEPGDLTRF